MNREFENALASWEAGGLSRDELARRFPGEDVAGLLTAFDGMQAAATGPTPDPAAAWEAIRPQLPVPLAHRRMRSRGVRLLAAALVALLAMGATAYAFVPGVRRAIGSAFTGSDTAPHRTSTTDVGSLVDDPATDPDGPAAGEDEGSAGAVVGDNDGQDQDEDHEGSVQDQGEDEGDGSDQGSEAADGGASAEDEGTQGSGSEEGSGDGGTGGGDHDAERPEQPEDGESGN